MYRIGFVFFVSSLLLPAQPVAFGVTAGVPVSPHTQTSPQGCFPTQPAVCGPNDFYSKSYTVGPSVEVRLPWRFSIAAAALYQRFHQDLTAGLVVYKGGGASFGSRSGAAGPAWMFPLLLNYDVSRNHLHPFVSAGATLRHLSVLEGQGFALDITLKPLPLQAVRFDPDKALDVAITAGGGVRFRVARFDVVPELRFLHWTSPNYQPVQNQLMLLVNLRFPARR